MTSRRAVPVAVLALLVPFLSGWEGMDLIARHQSIDPRGVITFCIGATNYDDPNVRIGQKFTPSECRTYLIHDLPKYEGMLQACYPEAVQALPAHRHTAFLDFIYNLGSKPFCKRIVPLLRAGRVHDACKEMLAYNRARGIKLRGLVRRREAEYAYCERGD